MNNNTLLSNHGFRHDNNNFTSVSAGSTRNPGNNDGEGRAGTDKSNLVEIDDSGSNVKFKENGEMISKAKLRWTPDRKIKSMEDVKVALATSGFDFSGGKQGRLGRVGYLLKLYKIVIHCATLHLYFCLALVLSIYCVL